MEHLNKVAKITFLFWCMKIVATTLGETLGDFIAQTLGLGYTKGMAITFIFFIVVLSIQLFSKRFIPLYFWLVIIGTTTLGTEISDFMDRRLGLGYTYGSLILCTGLVLILTLWHVYFKSLTVYPIYQRKKELLFWTAVLFSNSLGTAFGDYLSDNLGMSYLTGALVTGFIILLVIALHFVTKGNQILLFWIAFVCTRPFGATFGDFLTKPLSKGGLDLGTLAASSVAMLMMGVLILISHLKLKQSKKSSSKIKA